ncbi:MAG: amidohydrolase family protein [Acidobacteriota bacterium]|nr:amidohydrolase family protein [Acidobacteriota bacterium]
MSRTGKPGFTKSEWQNFEEKTKGSIEVGKLAAFVILPGNPLTVAPSAIKDIAIQKTIVGEQPVYQAR